MKRLLTWWQGQTADGEPAMDVDAPAWLVSLVVNMALLIALALLGQPPRLPETALTVKIAAPMDEVKPEEPKQELPKVFVASDQPQEDIGALGTDQDLSGVEVPATVAPNVSEAVEVPTPVAVNEAIVSDIGTIKFDPNAVAPVARQFGEQYTVKGVPGVGRTGATGAIDVITQEILRSLETRKTLVVWMFDGSISMMQQRKEVHDRFDRIYKELDVIEKSGNVAFTKHDDKPLLTSVVSFGSTYSVDLKQPTDDVAQIKAAVAAVKPDRTGQEKTFAAVLQTANQFKKHVLSGQRKVMLVVFTDEAGDDTDHLDESIAACRKFGMPVYVVGVPAPFGRVESEMKYIDPDPKFDQSPQWGRVHQGPESLHAEHVKIQFVGERDEESLDSGFGSYGLTRLCYETNGIYFTVHPNRNAKKEVTKGDTANLSAHLKHFFDEQLMRRYRPDYVSVKKYEEMLMQNRAMGALVRAAQLPQVPAMKREYLSFPKRDEGELVNKLTDAQKQAAFLEPKILMLYQTLAAGEQDRPKIQSPRWQAGYDLAMGRALAAKVRTEAYNAMLAKAKTMKFKDPKNNTWNLHPVALAEADWPNSVLEKEAKKAETYLTRVAKDHEGTPWSLLAKKELETGLGWVWKESFTPVPPPARPPMNNNPAPPPANDKAQMLKKPPEKRPLPPL